MTINAVTWYGTCEEEMRAGEAVAIRVDRTTGKTTVRRITASDLGSRNPPVDFRALEREAYQHRDEATRGH